MLNEGEDIILQKEDGLSFIRSDY